MVARKTGYLALGKLPARTTDAVNHRATQLTRAQPRPVRTITADNGTEFHGYAATEAATHACDAIAAKLNRRPRKRLGYRSPEECHVR